MIRISIIRTFGLVLVVIGLILTIYGHLANRTCVNCSTTYHSEEQHKPHHGHSSIRRYTFVPSHQSGNGRYKSLSEPAPRHEERKYNEETIKYCKLFGPISFVAGLFTIFISFVLEKRSRVAIQILKAQPHWTDEIAMQVLAEQNRMKKQGNVQARNVSIHPVNSSNGTPIERNESAQNNAGVSADEYGGMTCLALGGLDESVILEPPPAYEEAVVQKDDPGNDQNAPQPDHPPSYEESTNSSST